MENDNILSTLVELLDVRGRADPGADLRAIGEMKVSDLGLDSLDLLQFVIDVENRLGIEADADDLPVDATLAELADFFSDLQKQ